MVVYLLSDGGNGLVSKGSNVKTAVFFLLRTGLFSGIKIDLSGFENGYWKDRLTEHLAGIANSLLILFNALFIIFFRRLLKSI